MSECYFIQIVVSQELTKKMQFKKACSYNWQATSSLLYFILMAGLVDK